LPHRLAPCWPRPNDGGKQNQHERCEGLTSINWIEVRLMAEPKNCVWEIQGDLMFLSSSSAADSRAFAAVVRGACRDRLFLGGINSCGALLFGKLD